MEHDRPEARAAHSGIADPDHVGHPLPEQIRRHRQVPELGHARGSDGSPVLEHEDVVGVDVQRGVIDRGVQLVDVVEDDGTSFVLEEAAAGGRDLEDRPVGAQAAAQDGQAAAAQQRAVSRPDHVLVDDRGAADRVAHRLPVTVRASRCSRSGIWARTAGRPPA